MVVLFITDVVSMYSGMYSGLDQGFKIQPPIEIET